MKDGTGLREVEKVHPYNFTDVGIAEEYAVTLAAGMAAGGLKPFVAVYSTFLQRAYDQILHDVCLQNLPVVFCLDRAGLVGTDGKTHQGVFDLSYLTHMPNMTVLAPNTTKELSDAVDYAYSLSCPVAIRYPKNAGKESEFVSIKDSLWRTVKAGDKVTLIAVGPTTLDIAERCAEQFDGVGVVSARSVKPLCTKTLDAIKDIAIITLEENSVIGGFGSLVADYYLQNNVAVKIKKLGIKDKFVGHGSIKRQLEENMITVEGVSAVIKELL